jgi:hypothetical protein
MMGFSLDHKHQCAQVGISTRRTPCLIICGKRLLVYLLELASKYLWMSDWRYLSWPCFKWGNLWYNFGDASVLEIDNDINLEIHLVTCPTLALSSMKNSWFLGRLCLRHLDEFWKVHQHLFSAKLSSHMFWNSNEFFNCVEVVVVPHRNSSGAFLYIFTSFWYVNIKNIFFKIKKYYFNIFLSKTYFKKQWILHS